MSNYKTEWVQPSYGCCYMTKEDNIQFKNAKGKPKDIFATQTKILRNYEPQYPFNGDGKLFNLTDWDEYQKSLPNSIKVNAASADEQLGKTSLINIMSNQTTEYIRSMLTLMKSLSLNLNANGEFNALIENKHSTSRKNDEGVINNTGNRIKGISLAITPAISDTAGTISSEFQDADNKSKSIMESKLKMVKAFFKKRFGKSFNKIKNSFIKYKTQLENFQKDLLLAQKQLIADITYLSNLIKAQAQDLQKSIAKIQAELVETLTKALQDAIAGLVGAFGGLATLLLTPLSFASLAIIAGGGNTADAKVKDVTSKWKNGIPKRYGDKGELKSCPAVGDPRTGEKYDEYTPGMFAGWNAKAFTPKDKSNDEDIDNAKIDAIDFAKSKDNGVVWDDCLSNYFVAIWPKED